MIDEDGIYRCTVCGWLGLQEPPVDTFEICPCCGTEFGYDDASRTHAELRAAWIAQGMPWHSAYWPASANWNPAEQLRSLEEETERGEA